MLFASSCHVARSLKFARPLATSTDTAPIPIHAPLTHETLLKIQSLLGKSVETTTTRAQGTNPEEDADVTANAAVLIPLCNVNSRPGILFEVRGKLRTHSGEVSFPGGKIDETDKSPEDAAVRETWEELGVPPKHIHILNCMDAWQEHSLMRFRVLPVVGYISPHQNNDNPHHPIPSLDLSSLALSANEVAHVFHLPFSEILASTRRRRNLFRGVRPYYTVDVSDKIPRRTQSGRLDDDDRLEVWGLTGWYLSLLMRALGTW